MPRIKGEIINLNNIKNDKKFICKECIKITLNILEKLIIELKGGE